MAKQKINFKILVTKFGISPKLLPKILSLLYYIARNQYILTALKSSVFENYMDTRGYEKIVTEENTYAWNEGPVKRKKRIHTNNPKSHAYPNKATKTDSKKIRGV